MKSLLTCRVCSSKTHLVSKECGRSTLSDHMYGRFSILNFQFLSACFLTTCFMNWNLNVQPSGEINTTVTRKPTGGLNRKTVLVENMNNDNRYLSMWKINMCRLWYETDFLQRAEWDYEVFARLSSGCLIIKLRL